MGLGKTAAITALVVEKPMPPLDISEEKGEGERE